VDTRDFYSDGDAVTNFRYDSFFSSVGSGVWMVEFYAPWCKPCQELVPEFKGAAIRLEGKAKFGAVNCDDQGKLCERMNIHSFPTVKFFMVKKGIEAEDYEGEHETEKLVSYINRQLKPQLVKLTDKNFEKEVLQSKALWLVDFSGDPSWCGPCAQLLPSVREAASTLKGVAKVGLIQCDQAGSLCERLGIENYPVVRTFKRGPKDAEDQGEELPGNNPFVAVQVFTTVAKSALTWRECFDAGKFKEHLENFFQEHNPGNVMKVNELMDKYRGNEEKLASNLELKYKGVKFGWDFTSAADDDHDEL
jgi:thiol-disulfide isomerase/thioredoxin